MLVGRKECGRPGGIRTPNPRIWSPMLYQFELLACNLVGTVEWVPAVCWRAFPFSPEKGGCQSSRRRPMGDLAKGGGGSAVC